MNSQLSEAEKKCEPTHTRTAVGRTGGAVEILIARERITCTKKRRFCNDAYFINAEANGLLAWLNAHCISPAACRCPP